MTQVINVQNVFFSYREESVLENVSFNIERGEYIAVFGPNGGGKTTLLKLLLGFLEPKKGKIALFGQSPFLARSSLAYVPQAMRFDKQFPISVLEVVLQGRLRELPWWGRFGHQDEEEARSALHLVGLCDLVNRPFGTLSGGQAQRVLIARALISHPKILFLDEPTANIDAQGEGEIYRLLAKLKGDMTIVMVTHDLQGAINQVDRVFLVQKTVTPLLPKNVCEHFAIGLYHPLKRDYT
jgi:zinc transport system ATP-binding protein